MYDDETLLKLINSYAGNIWPRGLGNPVRKGRFGYYIAQNAQDVLNFIKANNYTNVYMTVYGFTEYANPKEDKGNAIVNVLPFDFDSADIQEAHDDVIKLINWCNRHNIIPSITFSGAKGYHLYIYLNEVALQNPAETIRRFVAQMNEQADFNTLDTSVTGDLNRIMRIPGSVHKTTHRFCTPLDPATFLDLSLDEIKSIAELPTPYIPKRVPVPYEIEVYLKAIDDIVTEELIEQRQPKHKAVQGSILAGLWAPDIPKSTGMRNCIAFDRAMQTGAIQGHHGDETLSGVIQMLRSMGEPDIDGKVREFNKLCKPPFDESYLNYKTDYHLTNEYAPCTFFLKCGNLCKGCNKR